ncbi:MAG: hypothetical protein HZC42_13500 [Candidatus Eisenbacteria bacterium]|nr:hypothetical protein [Candidatus Eisenbacteria bacterium]
MRKSFVALALLAGAAAFLTNLAFAQAGDDPGLKLMNSKLAKERLSRASRLGTSAAAGVDTTWVGHSLSAPNSGAPWFIGTGPNNPGVSNNGLWDWDNFNAGENDSLQGWTPMVRAYSSTGGLTLSDISRPWWCLDYGNQGNYKLNSLSQNRTFGVNGVWHVDGGSGVPSSGNAAGNLSWAPVGSGAAWCGLRAQDDQSTLDAVAQGGYGNAFNGEVLQFNGETSGLAGGTSKRFPGYGSQWDQLLYRDVRVANGASLTVSFTYVTKMSTGVDVSSATRSGWFDKDPTSLGAGNFISSTNSGATAPIDSFMVYIGIPANPTSYKRADGSSGNVVYDLKRRWFSEVLAVDGAASGAYLEMLTVAGDGSAAPSFPVANALIQGFLDDARNGGPADGGGILRVVFRSKTNRGFDDQGGGSTGYTSGTEGAVRIDDVSIVGGTSTITSPFDAASEINNAVEAPNAGSPGPAVGQGYALAAWHATGKPPAIFFHPHPIHGGDIGGGNFYAPLDYHDLCGDPESAARFCNIHAVVISAGDHDNAERAGGDTSPAAPLAWLERSDGMVSPSICMTGMGAYPAINGIGLDEDDVDVSDDIYEWYDMYAGVFNLSFSGQSWMPAFQSWPATQVNGIKCWGELRFPGFMYFNPEPQCFWNYDNAYGNGLIATSNVSGIPDSLRAYMGKQQQCFRFAVTLGCSPLGGAYWDNISVGFVDLGPPLASSAASAVGTISVDIWQWFNDCFPANETPGLPGTAAYDTTAALLQNGTNTAAATGTALRFDVPGDSVRVVATGSGVRVDMVFRIFPGPGNYVTIGNTASGLRAVPTSPAPAGAGSFFGEYMLANGQFGQGAAFDGVGQGPGHGGAWNVNLWNSARCDTGEFNYFPVAAKGNLPGITLGRWASQMHEAEPKFATLGIVKNRCFLVDTLGAVNSTNTTCSAVPAWATTVPGSRTGYDGVQTTNEYTKIIPDGLLTPGSHVEYFFRKCETAAPTVIVMAPDTNRIYPQSGESSSDGHRWQEFSVLPDKWKDVTYGGLGAACMLYVDLNDRRGNERTWVGVADTIGATASAKYGAHNGWHAGNNYNYTSLTTVGGDPTIAVWSHGGCPGTTWDMYGVKASESLTTSAGALGNRLANRSGMGLMTGKQAMQGPTPEVLRTYYKILMILTGDLTSGVLGPFTNRSQNDVALLEDFMAFGANPLAPRGVFVQGDGFAQSETQTAGIDPAHLTLLSTYLALSLRDPSYQSVSGNLNDVADLLPTSVVDLDGDVFGVRNNCLFSNDIYLVNGAVSGATVGSYYQSAGVPIPGAAPFIASVYAPSTVSHPYVTLVDGWEIEHLTSRFDENAMGRIWYFFDVFNRVFASICAVAGTPTVDVPQNTGGSKLVNFMNLRNNPLSSGTAAVHFGLTRTDRVQVKVYDVSGRLVRNLADRTFSPGVHDLVWDGSNDAGQQVARGVYFTQVKFVNSRFVDAKKLTVLK